MKILVTGATGFIGSNLARSLVGLNHEVLTTGCFDEQPDVPGTTRLGYELDKIPDEKLAGVEMVYHQAANNDTQVKDWGIFWKENVLATRHLFGQLHGQGCRKFVYASSTAVYGDSPAPYDETSTPLRGKTPYALSKGSVEWWVDIFSRRHDISAIGLRYCNVYGPGEGHKGHRASMIHQIIKKIRAGESPRLFRDGEQRRDWAYVDDVVDANLRCMNYAPRHDVLNVGSGTSRTFNTIVSEVNSALGTDVAVDWIDNPYGDLYQNHTECKIEKARTHLGYEPSYDLSSGIRRYLENWG